MTKFEAVIFKIAFLISISVLSFQSFSQIPKFTITCKVLDTDTKKPVVKAKVELTGSDNSHIKRSVDNKGICFFDSTEVSINVKYKVAAMLEEYLTKFDTVSTINIDSSKDFTVEFDYPIYSMDRIILPGGLDATFSKNSYELSDEFKKALDWLVLLLNNSPFMTIGIEGFSDQNERSKGDSSLIFRRTAAVTDCLVRKGINKKRIICSSRNNNSPFKIIDDEYKGFKHGDILNKKTIKNLPSKGLKDLAHQLNRRVTFEVLGTNFQE